MKTFKFYFAFFLAVAISACGNDDDGGEVTNGEADRIVGTWRIQSLTLDGESVELSDCEKSSTIKFLANGDIVNTNFFEDFETEECVSEVTNEDWEYLGNNIYRITDEDGSYDVTVVFSNNNNTFTVSEETEEGSYSAQYTRV